MKIRLTAQFTTSVTREIEVDDEFIPITCEWEFNVYYEDGSEDVVKDKLIQFISECVYIAE